MLSLSSRILTPAPMQLTGCVYCVQSVALLTYLCRSREPEPGAGSLQKMAPEPDLAPKKEDPGTGADQKVVGSETLACIILHNTCPYTTLCRCPLKYKFFGMGQKN